MHQQASVEQPQLGVEEARVVPDAQAVLHKVGRELVEVEDELDEEAREGAQEVACTTSQRHSTWQATALYSRGHSRGHSREVLDDCCGCWDAFGEHGGHQNFSQYCQ